MLGFFPTFLRCPAKSTAICVFPFELTSTPLRGWKPFAIRRETGATMSSLSCYERTQLEKGDRSSRMIPTNIKSQVLLERLVNTLRLTVSADERQLTALTNLKHPAELPHERRSELRSSVRGNRAR